MRSVNAADSGWRSWLQRSQTRGLTWVLAGMLLLLQYPLWFGAGGWLRVREGAKDIETQQALNERLNARNVALLAEVSDLKQGRDAIEERAREDLGMIALDEWFVRVVPASPHARTVGNQTGNVNE